MVYLQERANEQWRKRGEVGVKCVDKMRKILCGEKLWVWCRAQCFHSNTIGQVHWPENGVEIFPTPLFYHAATNDIRGNAFYDDGAIAADVAGVTPSQQHGNENQRTSSAFNKPRKP